MLDKLEHIALAGKKAKDKFVLGGSLFLATLSFSPEETKGQDLGSEEMVCERYVEGEGGSVNVVYEGDYYFIQNPGGKAIYVQDDLVRQGSDDCYYIDATRSAPGREINGHPSVVVEGSNRTVRGSYRDNPSWGEVLAAGALSGIIEGGLEALFGGSNNEKSRERPNTGINVESTRENHNKDSDESNDPARYQHGPGEWPSKRDSAKERKNGNDQYGSWSSSKNEGGGNVRNNQGRRANGPEDGSKDGDGATWSSDSRDNETYKKRERVADVSPGLTYGDDRMKKFGEAPLTEDLYSAKQNVEDMQGKDNAVDNWYDKNLRRANDYFGCGDPASKESSFLCWEAMPNSNSDYNDLAKIATYKLIPK